MRIKADTSQTCPELDPAARSAVPSLRNRAAGWSAPLVALPGRFALVGLDVVGGELKTRSRGVSGSYVTCGVKLQLLWLTTSRTQVLPRAGRTASAFPRPEATSTMACRMVPMPWVRQCCRDTYSRSLEDRALSLRVGFGA